MDGLFYISSPRSLVSILANTMEESGSGQSSITPSLTPICRRRITTSVSGGSGGRPSFAADARHWSTVDITVLGINPSTQMNRGFDGEEKKKLQAFIIITHL
jgi:hypothetical protein